jgi:hypothetical protein
MNTGAYTTLILSVVIVAAFAAGGSPGLRAAETEGGHSGAHWWKGNLHTHTFWSDGDDFPEMAVDWYKENGYHFLVLSDHNILSEGQKWVSAERRDVAAALPRYRERFGEEWVEAREVDEAFREWLFPLPGTGPTHNFEARRPPDDQLELGKTLVRLKPLSEFRHLFEKAGRFLMIRGEEITGARGVHVNATNLVEMIAPQPGETTVELMQNTVDAVLDQRRRTGQAMMPHIAHPNFGWAIQGEQLAAVERMLFFEVYNGHFAVNNAGDEYRVGLDRMWDIVLTLRLAEKKLGVVYGLATDDTHNYRRWRTDLRTAGPGRGWVMVRAPFLTPEALIQAMEAGDFYSSTGVVVDDFRFDGERFTVAIRPEEGVAYRTLFVGTRRGYDASSTAVIGPEGLEWPVTRRYSEEVGEILAEIEGSDPSYTLRGDELYVRAKVISDKPKPDGFQYQPHERFQVAWLQPVVPGE